MEKNEIDMICDAMTLLNGRLWEAIEQLQNKVSDLEDKILKLEDGKNM